MVSITWSVHYICLTDYKSHHYICSLTGMDKIRNQGPVVQNTEFVLSTFETSDVISFEQPVPGGLNFLKMCFTTLEIGINRHANMSV